MAAPNGLFLWVRQVAIVGMAIVQSDLYHCSLKANQTSPQYKQLGWKMTTIENKVYDYGFTDQSLNQIIEPPAITAFIPGPQRYITLPTKTNPLLIKPAWVQACLRL